MSPVTQQAEPFELCSIRCTSERLLEIDSGRVMVSVSRPEIQRIKLRHGIQAPHPILQIGMGMILIAFVYLPAKHFLYWLRNGGVLFDFELPFMTLVVVGIWLIFSAAKRGYFLELELKQGRKRLAFRPKPDPAGLSHFIAALEQRYAIRVESDGTLRRGSGID